MNTSIYLTQPQHAMDDATDWTALLDVMMNIVAFMNVLFMFFFVSVMNGELAGGGTEKTTVPPPTLTIHLNRQAEYLVDGDALSLTDLKTRLARTTAGEAESATAYVFGDTNAPYGAFTELKGLLDRQQIASYLIVAPSQ